MRLLIIVTCLICIYNETSVSSWFILSLALLSLVGQIADLSKKK